MGRTQAYCPKADKPPGKPQWVPHTAPLGVTVHDTFPPPFPPKEKEKEKKVEPPVVYEPSLPFLLNTPQCSFREFGLLGSTDGALALICESMYVPVTMGWCRGLERAACFL